MWQEAMGPPFARWATSILALVSVVEPSVSSSSEKAEQVWLFIDPIVAPSASNETGWKVHIPQPRKEQSNPLLTEDKLWDVRWDNTYPTVRYDAQMKAFRMWYNAFVADFHPHPAWAKQFPPPQKPWPRKPSDFSATLYATSEDGVSWTKPELNIVSYEWNGTASVPLPGGNNILLFADGNPDRGVMYDAHDKNQSRRYKCFGSFWSNLCRSSTSKTPSRANDGTTFPPCHNLGVAYSADGIHFDHASDESTFVPGNAPGLDNVGQNDGALDLALWDDSLGAYWGLVRLDVAGPPKLQPPWGGKQGFRRTGRFETKDFQTFSAGMQVFHGRAGYEIYTIQPFRLSSYRPGYYLATAMFYNTTSEEGIVNCELLQSTNYGKNWSRVAPEGTQFIPRGTGAGAFDSHTLYTAWTGDAEALVDPHDAGTTMFYYSGGNGPHSGSRDDSIGLARATTHGYAGMRAMHHPRRLSTSTLTLHCHNLSILASIDDESAGSINISARLRVTQFGKEHNRTSQTTTWTAQQTIRLRGAEDASISEASWFAFDLGWSSSEEEFLVGDMAVIMELEAVYATIFAIRAACD